MTRQSVAAQHGSAAEPVHLTSLPEQSQIKTLVNSERDSSHFRGIAMSETDR